MPSGFRNSPPAAETMTGPRPAQPVVPTGSTSMTPSVRIVIRWSACLKTRLPLVGGERPVGPKIESNESGAIDSRRNGTSSTSASIASERAQTVVYERGSSSAQSCVVVTVSPWG